MRQGQKDFFILLEEFRKLNISSMLPAVHHGEFCILKAIRTLKELRRSDDNIRVSDIVEEMQAPPPAISRGLRALEERDLIYRHVDAKDRRNTLVGLTEKGQLLSDEIETIMEDFTRSVFERIGADSFEQLNQSLRQMVQISKEEIEKRKYTETKGE